MGIIRLLLALTVVIAHTNPVFGNKMIIGITSVHAFFIISGFYMALILNEKYTDNKTYKLYISNRFLRLFPVYWLVLILTILLGVFAYSFSNVNGGPLQPFLNQSFNMSGWAIFQIVFSSITLLGQDVLMFMGLNPETGNLYFSATHTSLWHYMIVPQSWTVGVEIVFYLIAPFLVRRNAVTLVIIILASLLLRVVLYHYGYDQDPWTFRFLPTEMAFFMSGALAYKGYKILKAKEINKPLNISILVFVIGITLFFQYIPVGLEYKQWSYYILIAITTPFIFNFTKRSKIDHWIGELTYPVYMSHIFIFLILGYLYKYTKIGPEYSGLVTIICSILFSAILIKYFIEPIERIRQKRVSQNKYIKK
jgi:peptidoglycan/LPS O-acetylase OafA/YrhL